MLEIEMKFPVADLGTLREHIARIAPEPPDAPRNEVDHYFNAPDRDFAKTDEALRIRQIGSRNVLTYKGPKLDRQTKTRKEIEVPLADGPEAAAKLDEMLRSLGYRPTATVRKQRTVHHLQSAGFSTEICLDDVSDVGQFVELEIVAPEDQLDAARQAVQDLARQLGLGASERRSYLEMWLEKHRGV
jgi:adenylate cyclase, class 2